MKQIYCDRPTILMCALANAVGDIFQLPLDHACKCFPIECWKDESAVLTWPVNVQIAGSYQVWAVASSDGAQCHVQCGDEKLCYALDEVRWNRVYLGSMNLNAGEAALQLSLKEIRGMTSIYSLEIIPEAAVEDLACKAQALRGNTQRFHDGRYGLQFHWTSMSCPKQGKRLAYQEAVEKFDVVRFADIVSEAGAGHVILTTSHAEFFFPGPNEAIDALMPGRTCQRDLIQEIIDELAKRNISLLLYWHMGHDSWDDPDGWWKRMEWSYENAEAFEKHFCDIISCAGRRYGKGLAGWFFDDGMCYYTINADFEKLTRAAKDGNPERVICYNPWIFPRMTDFQDYFCGEGYSFLIAGHEDVDPATGLFVSGPQQGLLAHTNFILEGDWVHQVENTPIQAPNLSEECFFRDMQQAVDCGITPSVNLEIYQDVGVGEDSLRIMRGIKSLLRGK